MQCPSCSAAEDKVIDSREVEHGQAIRRRRECLACGYRYTTFERAIASPVLFVIKRSGDREPFDREKVLSGVRAACKNRPIEADTLEALVSDIEEHFRGLGGEVTSQQLGIAVLDALQELDDVSYLRFASVYKGFEDAGDFAREAGLLTKRTAPKSHETA